MIATAKTKSLVLLLASAAGAVAIGLAAPASAAPFPNCKTAKSAGYCDIPSDSPYYSAKLDRDGDGYACEC